MLLYSGGVFVMLLLFYSCVFCFFFFFKQKTAYEMLRSLVGSEMCIRDSSSSVQCASFGAPLWSLSVVPIRVKSCSYGMAKICLLYTSDAADDLLCVDLGGRRIIKKKKTE